MKRKIDMQFGGGYNTILYSARRNCFFAYEQEAVEIHSKYGGRQYYSSRTGLSGAGFLEVDPINNDLIQFGYYRTDAMNEQRIETVHTVNGCPVFGYAPIISHGGIDQNAPFVLADGRKVAFVHACDVRDTILKWEGIKGKEIKLNYYDRYGHKEKLTFQLYNPDHFREVRATRFIDLRGAREATREMTTSSESLFEQKLNIVNNDGYRWFHLSIDGIFDMKWDEDPREIVGEVVPGWYGAGDGLYWRRGRNGVKVFMEIKRSSLNGGKYVVDGKTSEFIDYEQNFSILEWFSKDIDAWKKHFVAQVTKKTRMDYVYACQCVGIDTYELMKQHPDVRVCLQDSLDVGNCRSASEEFVEQYKIKLDEDGYTAIKALLENPNIDEMLRNFNFQKTIHYKLVD